MSNKKKRNIFILDTSVMLYDKCSIHSFPGSDVVIPLIALDELDRFKDKKGVVGENARYVNRYLDSLRSIGNLHSGVKIGSQTLKVDIKTKPKIITIAQSLDGGFTPKSQWASIETMVKNMVTKLYL